MTHLKVAVVRKPTALFSMLAAGLLFSTSCRADLMAFCLGQAPTDEALKVIYTQQCPGYLAQQFASGNATSQLAVQASQATLISSYGNMVKAPTTQVPTGTDITALAIAAAKEDSERTFKVAQKIGEQLAGAGLLSADAKALVVTTADLVGMASASVDPVTMGGVMDDYTSRLGKVHCPGTTATATAPALPALLLAVAGMEALGSAIATGASAFQPSLVGVGKLQGTTDPQQIMVAGLIKGLGASKPFVRVSWPNVDEKNTVLQKLGALRLAISAANVRLATCLKDPKDAAKDSKEPEVLKGQALIAEAKDFIAANIKTDGTKASALDSAVRRAALSDAKVKYTLLLSREVSGGGIAAVKPNWFQSTVLLMGTSTGISYRLVELNGEPATSDFLFDKWLAKCDLESWPTALNGGCTTSKD